MNYHIPQETVIKAKVMLDDGASMRSVARELKINPKTVQRIRDDESLGIGQAKAMVDAIKANTQLQVTKAFAVIMRVLGSITEKELKDLKKKDLKKFFEVLEKFQKIYRLETDQSTDNKSYHHTVMSTVRDRLDDQMFTPD